MCAGEWDAVDYNVDYHMTVPYRQWQSCKRHMIPVVNDSVVCIFRFPGLEQV